MSDLLGLECYFQGFAGYAHNVDALAWHCYGLACATINCSAICAVYLHRCIVSHAGDGDFAINNSHIHIISHDLTNSCGDVIEILPRVSSLICLQRFLRNYQFAISFIYIIKHFTATNWRIFCQYDNLIQAAAAIKRIPPDARKAVSYRYARQARAFIKRIIPNARNAVPYLHARQAAAI